MDSAFQNIRADAQVLEGDLSLRSNKRIPNCSLAAKERVLNKFLDEGFERTATWRPIELRSQDLPKDTRSRIYQNIYITGLAQVQSRGCHCHFQLNLASTRKILEDENLIPAFGY